MRGKDSERIDDAVARRSVFRETEKEDATFARVSFCFFFFIFPLVDSCSHKTLEIADKFILIKI